MNIKVLLISLLVIISNANAGWFSDDEETKINQTQLQNVVSLKLKEKINSIFNKFSNQSVTKDKNIIYYRPDPIYRKPPKIYKIWTRADIVSFEHGKYYYIVPEGYKTIYEKEGEIYIDYEPTASKINLNLENEY